MVRHVGKHCVTLNTAECLNIKQAVDMLIVRTFVKILIIIVASSHGKVGVVL